ncbi:preprotein translocase subunit YajC [Clostridium beijerinckii]|uniref:preprotein translocase subunit YajC n=1 Tax=Clostridium beijerinckii TaxID=1520 RepID=UPI00047E2AF8|nr:preprotein translocase subunit YajC [Clostridium beijerinckii]
MENMSALLVNVVPFLLVFVIFYFLLILPEKKRKKKYQGMLEELKVNDEIVTRGGIIGKITHIDEKSVTIESGPAKTKIKLDKSGISHKIKVD